MRGSNDRLNVSTDGKVANYFDLPRIQEFNQIIQNPIRDVFMKDLFLAKRINIEFQGLEFDAPLIWYIGDIDRRKVWISTARTNAGEFGAGKFYSIFSY